MTAKQDLLDAVRAIAAERDGLKQTLRDEINENLRLRELGGALPDENITAMTERLIRERDHFRDAAKMVSAAQQPVSDVPMPEPDIIHTGTDGELYGYWNEYQMIHYGDACKEAGYAAGVVASGEDARPTCEKCGGSGWVRGRELDDADDATFDDTMTRYSCDACTQPVSAAEVPTPDDIELVLQQYKLAVQVADSALNTAKGQLEAREKLRATESAVLRHLRTYGDALEAAGYARAERYRAALLKLACLGNGDCYGNSHGNVIAQEALAEGEVKP